MRVRNLLRRVKNLIHFELEVPETRRLGNVNSQVHDGHLY